MAEIKSYSPTLVDKEHNPKPKGGKKVSNLSLLWRTNKTLYSPSSKGVYNHPPADDDDKVRSLKDENSGGKRDRNDG